MSSNCAQWMAYEVVLLIVTMTHVKPEIACYSLLAQIPPIVAYIIMGATVEPKNMVNHQLRNKNYSGARKIFWKYALILLIFGICVCFPIYLFSATIFEKMKASPEIVKEIELSAFWLSCDAFIQGYQFWPRAMMISLDLKPQTVAVNIFFGGFCRIFVTWLFIITWDLGLPGVFCADFISLASQIIALTVIFEVIKDSKYRGVLEEEENKKE